MGSYVRRTQKDYSMSFKLQVVQEVEQTGISLSAVSAKYGIQGGDTVRQWIKKFGTFNREYQRSIAMERTKDQYLLELEQKIKVLEQQKATLEKQVHDSELKVAFVDLLVDMAEEEFKIPIRKKFLPGQSKPSKSNKATR